MQRTATAGFVAIVLAAALIAYRIAEPSQLYVEKDDSRILAAIATEQKAANAVLTPSATAYRSPTPTYTPKPPTETPLPTYGAQLTPGLYEFYPPDPTKTPSYDVIDWPLCEDLAASPTPMGFKRICEVKG